MALGTLFTVAAVLVVIAAASGGWFLYTRTQTNRSRFFTPRARRLAFVERTSVDGGRKLLLVRRDDVEHLILIGGPIDLVVETGIRPRPLANGAAAEDDFPDKVRSAGAWQRPDFSLPEAGAATPAGPLLSSESKENAENMLELTPLHEVKTVQ